MQVFHRPNSEYACKGMTKEIICGRIVPGTLKAGILLRIDAVLPVVIPVLASLLPCRVIEALDLVLGLKELNSKALTDVPRL